MGKGKSAGKFSGTRGSQSEKFSGTGGNQGGKISGTKGSTPKIHEGKQNKHIEGTNNYKQQIENGKTPSILTENPHTLLKEGTGKGMRVAPNKEVVDYGRVIGKFYDTETNKYYDTTRGTIHYDSKGNAHIVPARPNNFEK